MDRKAGKRTVSRHLERDWITIYPKRVRARVNDICSVILSNIADMIGRFPIAWHLPAGGSISRLFRG